ncbi:hypothetical protein KI387_023319 [Taxus chinensis]|uniref:GH10 domain-containing protein n=1 Tax=Taxus chinensis TaxID=29808 RepID=A0AA38LBP2_TAXCH|nr:hypothetical protein KI387_023319 [Taxus chinensis]
MPGSILFAETGAYYDSFATTKCVSLPLPSSYGGGIIVNPEFENGLTGWSTFGGSKLEIRSDQYGNKYIVASGRKNGYDSASQKLNLTQGLMYTLAACVDDAVYAALYKISGGNSSAAIVKATVAMKNPDTGGTTYNCAGTVIAGSGCWSLLKGGLALDFSPPSATIYFENRKGNVMVHIVDSGGSPLKGAKIMINQTRRDFPFGSAIAKTILDNDAYQKWFVERFNVATFENELKWYSTESRQGILNYKDADALVNFCKSHNITMRGHNIFWEDPKYTPQWVKDLPSTQQLQSAVESRLKSVVGRYKGQFLNWDVSNEMLHFSFFENKLGPNASLEFFRLAQQLDPLTPMFMNDYNTIETCNDNKVIPDAYLKKLQDIISLEVMAGIGLESHFAKPNIPLMRSILDRLGSTGLPIWLTEVDITNSLGGEKQAEYLEEVLREGFSHQFVDGIVMWSALHSYGCYKMCLTDNNFKNLATGDVVDKLIKEWNNKAIEGITDENGKFDFYGFYGKYQAIITHLGLSSSTNFKVSKYVGVTTNTNQPQHIHLVI